MVHIPGIALFDWMLRRQYWICLPQRHPVDATLVRSINNIDDNNNDNNNSNNSKLSR